jgi:hypothetical protein
MVTIVPEVLIVALPKALVKVQGVAIQLVHCTVVVRQLFCVPQAALVAQCAYMVPVKVLANTSGVVPKASTGPPGVPERIVIKSVATLLVNRSV